MDSFNKKKKQHRNISEFVFDLYTESYGEFKTNSVHTKKTHCVDLAELQQTTTEISTLMYIISNNSAAAATTKQKKYRKREKEIEKKKRPT